MLKASYSPKHRTVHQSAQYDTVGSWKVCEERGGAYRAESADDVELNGLGCRVDILGTNCDQCVRGGGDSSVVRAPDS